ncbi:Fe-S cluster assembly protein SufD [Radicibacter daui]|uniref:Fe-S cluster assembly protein SufD n=1 Tax=Radicibacter daui TaxID=3064829 RepID=UPI004046BFDC
MSAVTKSETRPAGTALADGFELSRLPGAGNAAVGALRTAARDAFLAAGLPGRRDEAWRYTSLSGLGRESFALPDGKAGTLDVAALEARVLDDVEDALRLAFVDGVFSPALSTGALDAVEGVSIRLLDTVLADGNGLQPGEIVTVEESPLAALSTALMSGGLGLAVPAGVAVERPVHVVFVTTKPGLMTSPRLLIELGDDAKLTVMESYTSLTDAAVFTNAVVEVSLGAGAELGHYKLQNESPAGYHISTQGVVVGDNASYDNFILTLGATLSRNQIRAELGTASLCHLNGGYMIHDRQLADTSSFIHHAQPDANSHQVYKGVIDGQAHGVFAGKIRVAPDAQRTDGYQLNRALLLSDTAEINAKPELEIFADDVKCSHGATAGSLDEDWLFYLRSRGIPLAEAQALLVGAFIEEALETVNHEGVRAALSTHVAAWRGRNMPSSLPADAGAEAIE